MATTKMSEIDLSQFGFEADGMAVVGSVRFPQLTEVSAGPYNIGKYTVSLLLPKNQFGNDLFAAAVNAANKAQGGRQAVVKDGDVHKPEYHADHWVVQFKQGSKFPPRTTDSLGQPIPASEINHGDTVRIMPRVMSYSTGSTTGATCYFSWIQLISQARNSLVVPVFEGGFVANDAKAVPTHAEEDGEDFDPSDIPAPKAIPTAGDTAKSLEMLAKIRAKTSGKYATL